jgi:ATP-dependent RNA helicase DeaD
MNKLNFESMGLSIETVNAIRDMGFKDPSPIQSQAIPFLMEGRDVIGQAQTGSGKTAAFAIPVIEKTNVNEKTVQTIVLCPTRELAMQIAEEFRKICKYRKNIFVTSIYGGQRIDRQLDALKRKPQIIVATPGRFLDHVRRKTIRLDAVKTIILDEADRMLDMGFINDINLILSMIPAKRQTVLFSATMSREILAITGKYLRNAQNIKIEQKDDNYSGTIKQSYLEVSSSTRFNVLCKMIDENNIKLCLVFCNTRRQVKNVAANLRKKGYAADALHGDLSQSMRDAVMGRFRRGATSILVATDIAGRGIDVKDIEAVFNYEIPRDIQDYTHRIGRTGRVGKEGRAFTFVTSNEYYDIRNIERKNKIRIESYRFDRRPLVS